MDREKVSYGLRCMCYGDVECKECPYARDGSGWHDCRSNCAKDALALLKEQEAVEPKTIPTELKQKMWNALYAEEDEYEKKFVGKEEHLNWFTVYRPWLQKGFDIAINAIAEWEGR